MTTVVTPSASVLIERVVNSMAQWDWRQVWIPPTMTADLDFTSLETFLLRVPSIVGPIGTGAFGDGRWWAKFAIDIDHAMAWRVVQEFGHVLNYVSLNEHLPTVFMPVSPPPYMNGGPRTHLSWVIEAKTPDFSPSTCAKWLEGRLPRPVEDLKQWELEDQDD